jgi:undecaprenyl-diphosphatase
MSTLLQLNYMLFQDMNAYAGQVSWFDAFMVFCANLLIFCWPILLLMVWGIPLNWRRRTLQADEIEIMQERRAVVLWTAIACLVAYALNLLIEQFVFEPRPFIGHKVHLLIAHAADSSFPSDHTAWSFAVVGMLAFAFLPLVLSAKYKRDEKRQRFDAALRRKLFLFLIVALVIGCLIGLARVFVGVHYPGDVLGGAFDGLVGAYLVTGVRRWLSRPTHAVLRFAHTIRIA